MFDEVGTCQPPNHALLLAVDPLAFHAGPLATGVGGHSGKAFMPHPVHDGRASSLTGGSMTSLISMFRVQLTYRFLDHRRLLVSRM